MHVDPYKVDRLNYIMSEKLVEARGHAIVTCGGHTGHMDEILALCKDADVAAAIVAALKK